MLSSYDLRWQNKRSRWDLVRDGLCQTIDKRFMKTRQKVWTSNLLKIILHESLEKKFSILIFFIANSKDCIVKISLLEIFLVNKFHYNVHIFLARLLIVAQLSNDNSGWTEHRMMLVLVRTDPLRLLPQTQRRYPYSSVAN